VSYVKMRVSREMHETWHVWVIQGHRNWYQSKAHMRLAINLPLCQSYIVSEITIYWSKISIFRRFTRPRLVWSPRKGALLGSRICKLASKKTTVPGLPGGQNRTLLRSL